MRLFTALDLPDAWRARCAQIQDSAALDARWTPPEQFHITVRFIGERDADLAASLSDALHAMDAAPAECVPYGLDVFPARRSPRVLILGLERTASLLALHEAVSDVLARHNVEREDRAFRPHVTLARVGDVAAEDVHRVLRAHNAAADLNAFRATALHLYESTLTPDGAVHTRRASIPLHASPSEDE
jgi:2'-5' RNA ligase